MIEGPCRGGVRRHSPIIVNSKSPRWDLKLNTATPRAEQGLLELLFYVFQRKSGAKYSYKASMSLSCHRPFDDAQPFDDVTRTAAGCRSQRNATARRGNWKSSARVGLGHGEMTLPGRAAAHVGGTAATSNKATTKSYPVRPLRCHARSTTTS